jgi:hypothetical protein
MRWERFNPLAGVVAVVLWIVGTFLLEKTDRPDGKSAAAMADWVAANDTAILVGAVIFGFGGLFFVWFLGALRTRLIASEGGPGQLTAIAFGSGLITAAMMVCTYLPHAKAAVDHKNMTDSAVESVVQVGDAFFAGVELFAIPFFLAVGLVAWRTRALPRWLTWITLLLALLLAIIPIGWAGVYVGLPLWTLITSIFLFRAEGAGPRSAPAT